MVEAIGDSQEMTVVKLDAISRLSATCERPQNLAAIVGDLASGLSSELPVGQWHLGMPAFEMLSKVDPDKARRIMNDAAVTSDVWQVRAAAARVATTLKDEATLIRLVDDKHPNVQTQALSGLFSLKSARVGKLALKALDSNDYQLIRQAALALQGSKEIDAVALADLPDAGVSHEGRQGHVTRSANGPYGAAQGVPAPLDSTGTSPLLQWRDELKKYLSDFDPNVASAAADILGVINGPYTAGSYANAPSAAAANRARAARVTDTRDDILRRRQPNLHDPPQGRRAVDGRALHEVGQRALLRRPDVSPHRAAFVAQGVRSRRRRILGRRAVHA